ncbi:MAG: hypothetical protein HYW48_02640 [Deltaproteobacteria bacterium]|nr:hypothetical protein [Deltaproteobacteria bacterium]
MKKLNLNIKFRRKKRNEELIKRMRRGDVLHTYDAQTSWYPPRPVIKKDKKELARLYGEEKETEANLSPVDRKDS